MEPFNIKLLVEQRSRFQRNLSSSSMYFFRDGSPALTKEVHLASQIEFGIVSGEVQIAHKAEANRQDNTYHLAPAQVPDYLHP